MECVGGLRLLLRRGDARWQGRSVGRHVEECDTVADRAHSRCRMAVQRSDLCQFGCDNVHDPLGD